MGERHARVQLDRLAQLRDRRVGASRGHVSEPRGKVRPGVLGIEPDRLLRPCARRSRESPAHVRRPELGARRQRPCQQAVGARILGIDLQRPPQQRLGGLDLLGPNPRVDIGHRLHDEAPGVERVRRPALDALVLGGVEPRLDRGDDALGDLVLQGEEVRHVGVVAMGPDLQAGRGVAQLGPDPEVLPRAPDAAVEHVAHAEVAADLLRVDRLAAVGERRGAGRDEQPPQAREAGDDVLGEALGEILLAGVLAEVGEGQHGDRGPGLRALVGGGRAFARLDGADEAVADARNRRDPVGAAGHRPEELAQRGDLDREVALLDGRPLPRRIHQIRFRHHLAGLLQQRAEQEHPAVPDRNGQALPEKHPGLRVQDERAEREAQPGHGSSLPRFCEFSGQFGRASILGARLRARLAHHPFRGGPR